MSGHRQSWRSPNASTSTSTKDEETDVHSHQRRRLKRSSTSFSLGSPVSRFNWLILSQKGARRDGFHGDHTSSATTLTSNGEKISVCLELVDPPGISVLSLDWSEGPTPSASTCPEVIAAHRDVVLSHAPGDPADYFVYQASCDTTRRPSLLLLLPMERPLRRLYQVLLRREDTGIMSGTGIMPRRDMGPSFVIIMLTIPRTMSMLADGPPAEIEARLFRSGSHEWKVFNNLHVDGANGGRDLQWWHTNVGSN